jgi:hypothetical protein
MVQAMPDSAGASMSNMISPAAELLEARAALPWPEAELRRLREQFAAVLAALLLGAADRAIEACRMPLGLLPRRPCQRALRARGGHPLREARRRPRHHGCRRPDPALALDAFAEAL